MRKNSAFDARKKMVVAVVAAFVLLWGGECFCADAGADTMNMIDSAIEKIREAAESWGDHLYGFSIKLFGYLAIISLVWNLGQKLFEEHPEFGDFFHAFCFWIITTGIWYFIIEYSPWALDSIVQTFAQLGGQIGDGKAVSASGVISGSFILFAEVLKSASFPSAVRILASIVWHGDIGPILGTILMPSALIAVGVAIILSCTFIAALLAMQLAVAYCLVYGGYFYLAFAGCEWTRPMAVNYLKAVLTAATEFFCTLIAFQLFAGLMKNMVADFKEQSDGGEAITLQHLIVIQLSILMAGYFVYALPRVMGKITNSIVTGINIPFSYGNMWTAGKVLASGGTAAAKELAVKIAKEAARHIQR